MTMMMATMWIYEIVLANEIDPEEGDNISIEILFDEFEEVQFTFEAFS